jgi:hypothetical protein
MSEAAQLAAIADDVKELKAQHVILAAESRRTSEVVGRLEPAVTDLDHALFGNGKPGLRTELVRLETKIHGDLEKVRLQLKIGTWVLSTVGGSILVTLVGIFVKMLTAG